MQMFDPSEAALAILAVIIHGFFGYLFQGRATYVNIKELNKASKGEIIPFFRQEYWAFIIFPILGYTTLIILTYNGFDTGSNITFSFLQLTVQATAFVCYFQSRKYKYTSTMLINTLRAIVMALGILSCATLAVQLFYYYVICITLGWIFIVLPFCMFAYYALFQVIAFQTFEFIKILKLTKDKRVEYRNNTQSVLNKTDAFIVQHIEILSPITLLILIVLLYSLYRYQYWIYQLFELFA